jgi:hypothetical protein
MSKILVPLSLNALLMLSIEGAVLLIVSPSDVRVCDGRNHFYTYDAR